ncbi:MAG: proton-conducting transporter membrane subunit, partial [Campylobacterota bacterium]|nr:proton-conducting transporter membrane subunit [Campylobacterota bacterium]
TLHVELNVFNEVTIGLHVTNLANFFAFLSAFSLLLISFLTHHLKQSNLFYILLHLLNASIFLILYADDYLLFFIGWEIMGVVTYFLLAQTLSSHALHKYIIFTMTSAFSLLMAMMILYSVSHSFLYSDARIAFEAMGELKSAIFISLMLVAFFIKLGAIGFHYWLVDSYEQSSNIFTPYLSAVMSKMAVFALIVLLVKVVNISTLSTPTLSYTLAIMGLLSSIIATFKAINEDSIKRVLAYSSIAQLGYIVTVLALANGVGGALYHSLIHTSVKLLLFINIAGVAYVTSKSKFSELGGLIYKMPHSFVMLLIGIIVLAGMPPLGGFNSKFIIYTTLMDDKMLLILAAMMFASASAFLYIYKLVYGIYLGQPTSKKLESIKEAPVMFLIPQYILATIVVLLGAYPSIVVPYFNSILSELHVTQMQFLNVTTLMSPMGKYNGFVVFGAFVAIFAAVLLFVVLQRSRKKEAKNRFDIAYCGEEPNDSTHLHYGYSIGKELRRIGFVSTILKNSSSKFYDFVAIQTLSFSQILRKIYSGSLSVNFHIAIIFVIILLWWVIK